VDLGTGVERQHEFLVHQPHGVDVVVEQSDDRSRARVGGLVDDRAMLRP
jgi:hypothetical protein